MPVTDEQRSLWGCVGGGWAHSFGALYLRPLRRKKPAAPARPRFHRSVEHDPLPRFATVRMRFRPSRPGVSNLLNPRISLPVKIRQIGVFDPNQPLLFVRLPLRLELVHEAE